MINRFGGIGGGTRCAGQLGKLRAGCLPAQLAPLAIRRRFPTSFQPVPLTHFAGPLATRLFVVIGSPDQVRHRSDTGSHPWVRPPIDADRDLPGSILEIIRKARRISSLIPRADPTLVGRGFRDRNEGTSSSFGHTGIPPSEYCADRTDYLCGKDGVESNEPVPRGLSRPGHLPKETKERQPAAAYVASGLIQFGSH